jgi:hypothetical protein
MMFGTLLTCILDPAPQMPQNLLFDHSGYGDR